MSAVISVENLSKKYIISHKGTERYTTLGDTMSRGAKKFASRFRNANNNSIRIPRSTTEEFWALKDLDFEIKQGERVGIIGRNGAGKSTLLKILSRITEPSSGSITIHGRVASLLEVGTGFHPELTGRENIFLNGAILGMSKADILRKFDEIVAFSEVEKFLDTPVKRYSSGMYVRLAFAVAAHLEPEILIVDEVLAVGDAQFQKKCMGKMEGVANEGRTVLFVSHNMGAINSLCSKGILLQKGKLVSCGTVTDVVNQYMEFGKDADAEKSWNETESAPGDDSIKLKSVKVVSENSVSGDVNISEETNIEIEYWNLKNSAFIHASIHLIDQSGIEILATGNTTSAALTDDGWFGRPQPKGIYKSICKIPKNFLNDRHYSVSFIILTEVTNVHVYEKNVVSFAVHDSGEMRDEFTGEWLGIIRPKLEWSTENIAQL
jgi:lipopolysaccharide transport system ATP-binding protein